MENEEKTSAVAGTPLVVQPIQLGRARGEGFLKPGWDDPLTDQEIAELFGGFIEKDSLLPAAFQNAPPVCGLNP